MKQPIWFTEPDIKQLNGLLTNTVCEIVGVQFTEFGPDFIRGTMPVDHRTVQSFGAVHGGANVILAETLGSFGANLAVDSTQYYCVGLDVNANHLRAVSQGVVTGTAKLLHRGRTTQVWEIKIEDDKGQLSCISRLTMACIKQESGSLGQRLFEEL